MCGQVIPDQDDRPAELLMRGVQQARVVPLGEALVAVLAGPAVQVCAVGQQRVPHAPRGLLRILDSQTRLLVIEHRLAQLDMTLDRAAMAAWASSVMTGPASPAPSLARTTPARHPSPEHPARSHIVPARHVRNRRLADALDWQAFCSLTTSPGARAYYDQLRGRGKTHRQALRQLANR